MRRWSRRCACTSLTVAMLPILAGCGGGEMGEEPMEEPAEQEQPQEEQPQMEPAEQAATASLTALNDSGVSGEVVFTPMDGSLTVAVTASNLGGAGDYPSHIHQGTCDEPGGVAVPLESPSAGQGGTGEAVSEVDAAQLEAETSYLVLVHSLQGAPVGCADIPESVLGGGM